MQAYVRNIHNCLKNKPLQFRNVRLELQVVLKFLTGTDAGTQALFDQSNIVYHSRMSGMIADLMPDY